MPTKQYCVTLEDTARDQLQRLLRTGNRSAREVARARILLKADAGETAATIAAAVEVAASTVERLRRRYCEEGLEAALGERPRPGNSRKLTGPQEAHLVAVACTPAPGRPYALDAAAAGRQARGAGLCGVDCAGDGAAGVKKSAVKPWQVEAWCIPALSGECVARMEDVLDLYEAPYDPSRPQACVDERPTPLRADARAPLPVQPGRAAKQDSEYERKGMQEVFVAVSRSAGNGITRSGSSVPGRTLPSS